jgi:hypothetical protein
MPRYRVGFHTMANATVEVEAEDEEAAIDAAELLGMPNICAQCSGWGRPYSLDLGDDWEPDDEAAWLVDDEAGPVSKEDQT